MAKPCNDCPFMKSTPLVGAPDWLEDILFALQFKKKFEHSCHKTDPKADGYVKGQARQCMGHMTMIVNEIEGTPGKGGVYSSLKELIETYLRHWLGDAKFEKMKRKKSWGSL